MATSVNVVVLAGTIAADPVERRMPSGEECTEIRLSVPESGDACFRSRSSRGTRRSARSTFVTSTRAMRCSCSEGVLGSPRGGATAIWASTHAILMPVRQSARARPSVPGLGRSGLG
jgi:hypothetical protein